MCLDLVKSKSFPIAQRKKSVDRDANSAILDGTMDGRNGASNLPQEFPFLKNIRTKINLFYPNLKRENFGESR